MLKYLFPAKVTVQITGLSGDAHTCCFLGFFLDSCNFDSSLEHGIH